MLIRRRDGGTEEKWDTVSACGTSGRGRIDLTLYSKKSQSPPNRYKRHLLVIFYLVDSPEGGHVHSLPPDGTCSTNTGGILTGPAVDDGIDQDLEGILATKSNLSHDNTCKSQKAPQPQDLLHVVHLQWSFSASYGWFLLFLKIQCDADVMLTNCFNINDT